MRIVRADASDVPFIMECAREFTSIIPDCPLDARHYESAWWNFITDEKGAIYLLMDDSGNVAGGIGGIWNHDLLTARRMAIELFWYVKPGYRKGVWPIKLLKAFEGWAVENKCQHVAMIHMECSMPDEMKSIYGRLGYSLFETMYRKKLL